MSRIRLLEILRSLRPLDHASSPDYARRLRIEWRVFLALERGGHLRPLNGRSWTRASLLAEALRPRLVLVVDAGANPELDTLV